MEFSIFTVYTGPVDEKNDYFTFRCVDGGVSNPGPETPRLGGNHSGVPSGSKIPAYGEVEVPTKQRVQVKTFQLEF